MGNTGLIRLEAEMTLLQPHLGETRHQELVGEGRRGTSKGSQGFGPYQNKPFKNSGRRPSGRLPCLNHSW